MERKSFFNRSGGDLRMPKGPRGQERFADAVANAVIVARIVSGEIEEDRYASFGKDTGSASGNARAVEL